MLLHVTAECQRDFYRQSTEQHQEADPYVMEVDASLVPRGFAAAACYTIYQQVGFGVGPSCQCVPDYPPLKLQTRTPRSLWCSRNKCEL